MAGFNGSGTFVRTYNWVTDKSNSVLVTASRFDTEDDGFATGLSTAICKDGQTTTTAAIPFAVGLKVNDGSASAPSAVFSSETNTGIYRPGTGQLGIAVLGSGVVVVSTASVAITGTLSATDLVLTNALPVLYGGTGDTGTAWATYTATATGNSAAIGTSGPAPVTTAKQKSIGKTQFYTISIAMGSATAACGTILVDLPATANTAAMAVGYVVEDGFAFVGRIAANTKVIRLARTDGSPIEDVNTTWIVSGVYEKQ